MYRTWGDIKREIISLGFEKDISYSKNIEVFLDGVNSAMAYIAGRVPIVDKIEFTQLDSGVKRFDLKTLTGAEDSRFMRVSSIPCYFKNSTQTVLGLQYEGESNLIIPESVVDDFTLWYEKAPLRISKETADDYKIELDYYAACILPKLAAYYIWRDDEPQKAIEYQNLAIDEINELAVKKNYGEEFGKIKTVLSI